MEPLSNLITTALITDLTGRMIKIAGKGFRQAVRDTPAEVGLRNAVKSGLVAFIAMLKVQDADQRDHLDTILRDFFALEDVTDELTELLVGSLPSSEKMKKLFKDAGYVHEQLPELNFGAAMQAFQQSFIAAALNEKELASHIQLSNLIQQSAIQGETLDTLKQVAGFVQAIQEDSLRISPGKITGMLDNHAERVGVELKATLQKYFAESAKQPGGKSLSIGGDFNDSIAILGDRNIVQQIIHISVPQGDGGRPPGPHADWENYYLKQLVTDCDLLDIVRINPEEQAEKGKAQQMRISEVFTQLQLEGLGRGKKQSVSEAILKQYSSERERAAGRG